MPSPRDIVRTWGNNPKIAAARTPAPPRKVPSYSLRCQIGQDSFDVAMTITSDGQTAHLKKTTMPKIEGDVSLEVLKETARADESSWVPLQVGDREILVKRRNLKNALRVLLAP